ncbi:hypothetical protein E3O42_14735 [Cryobacterium adonitolivorans]|uniref:YtxH domain-containing protein n=1 Tax=Cryobacterium adonitolivorans TaxID=1259189 RepID=A0A4R8W2S4_9MICO|nr:hypothetical protein [Cryobacterium adonitolivorans]TFB99053.1 hypothetical protein E3O42_14735 [Cryobacterium adonitolivorans]
MRGKLLFITGGLVGYVLGARAGRKRYDQIASAASDLWNRPPVQRRVNEVKDFALERVGDVPGALYEAGKKVASAVASKAEKKGAPATGASGAATAATKAAASAPKAADDTTAAQ